MNTIVDKTIFIWICVCNIIEKQGALSTIDSYAAIHDIDENLGMMKWFEGTIK